MANASRAAQSHQPMPVEAIGTATATSPATRRLAVPSAPMSRRSPSTDAPLVRAFVDRHEQRALALGARLGAGGREPLQRVAHRLEVGDPPVELGDLLVGQRARRIAALRPAVRQPEQALGLAQPEAELLRALDE